MRRWDSKAEHMAVALLRMTQDGAGNPFGAGAEGISGNIYSSLTATGTYAMLSDCWFTSTFTDSLGKTRNIAGALFQNGAEIVGIFLDASTVLRFTA